MGFDGKRPRAIGNLLDSRKIGELREAVRSIPDVRCDKVAALRRAIESGAYVVDAEKVARKMIDEAL